MPTLAILFTHWGGGTVQAHKAKGIGYGYKRSQFWAASRLVPGMQGDGSTTVPGGSMEVAMLDFDLAWI